MDTFDTIVLYDANDSTQQLSISMTDVRGLNLYTNSTGSKTYTERVYHPLFLYLMETFAATHEGMWVEENILWVPIASGDFFAFHFGWRGFRWERWE